MVHVSQPTFWLKNVIYIFQFLIKLIAWHHLPFSIVSLFKADKKYQYRVIKNDSVYSLILHHHAKQVPQIKEQIEQFVYEKQNYILCFTPLLWFFNIFLQDKSCQLLTSILSLLRNEVNRNTDQTNSGAWSQDMVTSISIFCIVAPMQNNL